jgi:hypothetical protein
MLFTFLNLIFYIFNLQNQSQPEPANAATSEENVDRNVLGMSWEELIFQKLNKPSM